MATRQIKEYSRLSAKVLGEVLYRERCELGSLTPFTAGLISYLAGSAEEERPT